MNKRWMKLALDEAMKARDLGEVPVGAVVVRNDILIGRGHNQVEKGNDASAHAEILALRDAGEKIGTWRMNDATLYVTLEPCPMCMGALHLARLNQIVFGASDPRFGACGSYIDLQNMQAMTTPFEITRGVMADEARMLLQRFFEKLRDK